MLIPAGLVKTLPSYRSQESVEDDQKMAYAKLMAFNSGEILYILEGQMMQGTWTFFCIMRGSSARQETSGQWSFGTWTEAELETYKGDFLLDTNFEPTALGLCDGWPKEAEHA